MTHSVHMAPHNVQIPIQRQFLRAHIPGPTSGTRARCHIHSPNSSPIWAGWQVTLNLLFHAIHFTHYWNLEYRNNVWERAREREGE